MHRWMAIAFTAGFIVNIIAMSAGEPPAFWVYLVVLVPLFILFPSGLYMFVLPYIAKRRGRSGRVEA